MNTLFLLGVVVLLAVTLAQAVLLRKVEEARRRTATRRFRPEPNRGQDPDRQTPRSSFRLARAAARGCARDGWRLVLRPFGR